MDRDDIEALAPIVMTIIVILAGVGVWLYLDAPSESGDETDEETPTPTPTFTLYLCNKATVEIHVYVYFDGVLKWQTYLGTGFFDESSSRTFDLPSSGVKITTSQSLGFTTWTIGGTWYDGEECFVYYHADGTVVYSTW
jgi:hypothetical protein